MSPLGVIMTILCVIYIFGFSIMVVDDLWDR